jgi:hypothetical protein
MYDAANPLAVTCDQAPHQEQRLRTHVRSRVPGASPRTDNDLIELDAVILLYITNASSDFYLLPKYAGWQDKYSRDMHLLRGPPHGFHG